MKTDKIREALTEALACRYAGRRGICQECPKRFDAALAQLDALEADTKSARREALEWAARQRTEPVTHLWPGKPTEIDHAIWRTAQLSMAEKIEKGGPGGE